eukprot:TRINITY_DN12463_c0_g1_i2.p1 TRINITY_DN12463_c0_g1~~TRINITY_DN12463_c0_g1_i2.p1  ORF type:complete len:180 (-),score=38.97 TRINITY_DN12463_c0_g1_i2:51-590(-)
MCIRDSINAEYMGVDMWKLTIMTILIFFSSAELSSDHDDAVKITEAMLKQFKPQESISVLMKCFNDKLWKNWKEAAEYIKSFNPENLNSLANALLSLTRPVGNTMKDMEKCDKYNEMANYYSMIIDLIRNESKFISKLIHYSDQVVADLRTYLKHFSAKDYENAGKTAALLVEWFYIHM